MHETALIQYALSSVERAARRNGIDKVTEIHLVIGKLRAALPQALQRGFLILSKGTMFEGASLTVEERDITLACKDCGTEWTVGFIGQAVCPCCSGQNAKVVSGKEMYIDYFTGTKVQRREGIEGIDDV